MTISPNPAVDGRPAGPHETSAATSIRSAQARLSADRERLEGIAAETRRAFPDLQVDVADADQDVRDQLASDGNATLAELVLPSTGPGHYTINVHDDPAGRTQFALHFVNVNDMPGDGDPLGTFDDAIAAATAARAHDTPHADTGTDPSAARQLAVASLGFPPAPASDDTPHRDQGAATVGAAQTPPTPGPELGR